MSENPKPTDAFSQDRVRAGFQIDKEFWKRIGKFVAFAEGKTTDGETAKTTFTKFKLVAHLIYISWNRSALNCTWTREQCIDQFNGISPMVKKPCAGLGCAVCFKYEECKTGEYKGLADPFPQVVTTNRLDPITIEEAEQALLFFDQLEERKDSG